jgi:hypothetical protein
MQGQHISVVYQTVPSIPALKFALAYRITNSPVIHGVATREHTVAMVLMIACSLWFGFGPQRLAAGVLACASFAALNGIYLGLTLKAKAALRTITTAR